MQLAILSTVLFLLTSYYGARMASALAHMKEKYIMVEDTAPK